MTQDSMPDRTDAGQCLHGALDEQPVGQPLLLQVRRVQRPGPLVHGERSDLRADAELCDALMGDEQPVGLRQQRQDHLLVTFALPSAR